MAVGDERKARIRARLRQGTDIETGTDMETGADMETGTMETDLHRGRRLDAAEIRHLLEEARARTLSLLGSVSEGDQRVQHDPLMSPILWDLGHIAHFEEVWLVEISGSIG